MFGLFNPAATNPLLVQSFVGVASSVIGQLPAENLAALSQGVADLARDTVLVDRITRKTEDDAKALLGKIVAVPEARRFHQQLQRFIDVWGVSATQPKPKPKPPREPVRLPRLFRPSWEGDDRYDQYYSRLFNKPYLKGTAYAALDRHSIVNA